MPPKKTKQQQDLERRGFSRLNWALDVEFTLVHLGETVIGIGWEKGRTRDVSRQGLCLETKALSEPTIKYLNQRNASLDLRIAMPNKDSLVKAVGDVAWFEKKGGPQSKEYIIGIKYRTLPRSELKKVMKNVR